MEKLFMKLVLTAAVLWQAPMLFAQTKVTGRVTDSSNQPIVGVTVTVKGSPRGTTTSVSGEYSIAVNPGDVLVFSFIGYTNVEEKVGSKTRIDIKLAESAEQIAAVEVVSMGYGTSLKRDLTGSVAKVDMSEVMKSNVTNFDQALSGRLAGVVVRSSDGQIGQEANIVIRGNNSLTQSNSPLFVIDGFQSESSQATALSSSDIESMQVLRDASATAIYGARGANGVIVITTKSGQSGKPRVNFSASFTVDQLANKMELMGPYEFVKLQAEMKPDNMATSYFSDGRDLEWYRNKKGYDWQDEVYRTAFTQNYSVSVAGGSPKGTQNATLYNISFSALDQDGILLNSNFQRYQGRVNVTQSLGKKWKLNANVSYTRTATSGITPTSANNSSAQSGWLIYSVWGYRPITTKADGSDLIADMIDSDAANGNDYRFNPVYSTKNEHRKTYVDVMKANTYLNYTILPGLDLKLSGGYTLNKRRREAFNNTLTYTGYPGSPSGKGINGGLYWTDTEEWISEATLTYNKNFGLHHLRALAGTTLLGHKYTYDGIEATQMTTEKLSLQALYTGTLQPVASSYNDWRQLSYFGRAEYDYDHRYYLNFTLRADGSSRFPTDNRWGYFPAVGLSWNFSQENWLRDSRALSNGKLRFSWGLTGNNRTSSPYDYYAQLDTTPTGSNSYDYVFDGAIAPGYYVTSMANSRLKWETTEQYNLGVDLGFLDERIRLTADFYYKETKDLLLSATMPSSSGYTSAMMNIGSLSNKGMEFTLETVNVRTPKFQWTSSFNIAFNRNKILGLADGQRNLLRKVSWDIKYNSDYPYISQIGSSTGMMYGLLYEGTYKYEDFDGAEGNYMLKDGIPYHTSVNKGNIRPGDPKYADINGDGVVNENDRTIIGRGQPIHTGGFNNTFTYGGFDLNVFMTWSYGNDILNANRLVFEAGTVTNTNQQASYAGRWTPENPASDIPRAGANAMTFYSSRVVEDGSFLRLNSISLGYKLPDRFVRRCGLASARVSVSVNNIHTFTNYSGPDPEVSTRSSVLTPGFDWSAYPRAFGITAGIDLSF
ncbi:SusC/RagA family TonB-linked outer membrane protein [Alistipes senegalensis]|uniref:SusC/RagA family TonB-linked outer membrane protein n=1 Tax=Alistipes senegalensis TaxID=1288121 RepID=UPI001E60DB33|nr:TonB-dependent receptor [Alistipes senegalensis]